MTQENCMKLYEHYTKTGQKDKADRQADKLKNQYGVEVSEVEEPKKKGKK